MGGEGEQLSTRGASPHGERRAQHRVVLENQPWLTGSYPALDAESSAYGRASLSTLCFIMDMEQLLAWPVLKTPHAKRLRTRHIQASTDGKYKTPDTKGAEKHHTVLLSLVDRN